MKKSGSESGVVVRKKTGVVGAALGVGVVACEILEIVHLMDWVHGLPHNEFVWNRVRGLLSQEGTAGVAIVAAVLVVISVWGRRVPAAASEPSNTPTVKIETVSM